MTMVRAAGGVVWRPGVSGDPRPRIALVHRPKYDDWSLPKGLVLGGEHPLVAAVREVREKTCIRAVPQTRLPSVRYRVTATGDEKIVEYWSMRATGWTKRSSDREVDAVRWIRPSEATGLLTYPQDRHVIRALASRQLVTGLVVLVRHAKAAAREGWPGSDATRPLDPEGMADAEGLASVLSVFDVERIISATPIRCAHTVAPLAKLAGLRTELDARFNEDADPSAAAAMLRESGRSCPAAVVCSQESMISSLLDVLDERRGTDGSPEDVGTPEGHGWLMAFAGDDLVSVDTISPLAGAAGGS